MPQQIADFLERRVLGEIVDVVAAIRQHAALAIEIADGRRRDDDVFETGFGGVSLVATVDDSVPRSGGRPSRSRGIQTPTTLRLCVGRSY